MKININHPLFEEYRDQWQSLTNEMNEKLSIVEEQNKRNNYCGRDDKSSEITKEYSKLFRELQERYSFLYVD